MRRCNRCKQLRKHYYASWPTVCAECVRARRRRRYKTDGMMDATYRRALLALRKLHREDFDSILSAIREKERVGR